MGEGLIASLSLEAHPEGGWYRRTWVAESIDGERPAGSAILYLLLEGERSVPHSIDATEIWHFYAGSVLELTTETPEGNTAVPLLGPGVLAGQEPQVVVPAGTVMAARSLGAYSLVGATVSPAFRFEG